MQHDSKGKIAAATSLAASGGRAALRPLVEVVRSPGLQGVTAVFVRQVAGRILAALDLSGVSLSVALIGTDDMQALNGQWRGKDKATDVLSFPSSELALPATPVVHAAPARRALGDLALCVPVAARQAELLGHSLAHEVTVLLVHGVLHLLGHDHAHGGRQAARMRREEDRLMRQLAGLGPAAALGAAQSALLTRSRPRQSPLQKVAGKSARPAAAEVPNRAPVCPPSQPRAPRRPQR